MKWILRGVITLILLPLVLLGLAIGIAMQQKLMTRSDLADLIEIGQSHGIAAVIEIIDTELNGVDLEAAPDPSYGRELVVGRGSAPWVVRGNLDGKPRMLKLALAPGLWAAYQVESQSLYQVWDGDIEFAGAAYNYKHGPQPGSRGNWYLQDADGARWFLEIEGERKPATVQYLGHEYGAGSETVSLRFRLHAGDQSVELLERPDMFERDGQRFFTRSFRPVRKDGEVRVYFENGNGESYLAEGTLEWPLQNSRPIEGGGAVGVDRGKAAATDDLSLGEQVIANSDCLSCHAETHKVTGPAWSQVSGKFRGHLQTPVIAALTTAVLEGSVGKWGSVPMPAHPELSETEARAAVSYILSRDTPAEELNPPLDDQGNPYVATEDFDILPRLRKLHPSFQLEDIAPPGFEPKVGGLDMTSDGKLVVASWDLDGAVYLVDPNAPLESRVQRIAEGLQEPLGLTVVDDRIFVLQKQELTELIDTNDDGVIDRYRAVSTDWEANSNFHSFAFGLVHKNSNFYFLLSICVLPGGASCPDQLPTQGKLLKADLAGNVEVMASGFRTPNGIADGPGDAVYVLDNQGDWLPASKLAEVRPGDFYGSRAVPDEGVMTLREEPPAVWLPQDEVGNSPTQPFLLEEGPYAGQLIHGDVFNGGLKRVFLENIAGRSQGAVFHFSAGFNGGVNRMVRSPDGSIYLGEVGNPPNWGEAGKAWHGLERLTWNGNNAFEMKAVRALSDGFLIELTQPLAQDMTVVPEDLTARQWFYHPNEQYGGPKYDHQELSTQRLVVAEDRRSVRAIVPGLKEGYVVYLRLDERWRAAGGQDLWTSEAWYTLNNIPDKPDNKDITATDDGEWRPLFDGKTLAGWKNFAGPVDYVEKWVVENGALTLRQKGALPWWDMISSYFFGGPSGDLIYYPEKFSDFELSLEWKIAENGNSGIFYLVKDETENVPWRTGIEMQVLHNEGHADGKIETHRAGDLYDLIAADPVTVRPPGEWNEVRIRIEKNHIEHWLNGEKVVSITRGSDDWNALVAASKFADMPGFGKSDAGYIVLQDHGDPVWYRNIKVRNL